ncbi:MAG: phosphodiester glycosidase family protein [Aquabacterium sp.]
MLMLPIVSHAWWLDEHLQYASSDKRDTIAVDALTFDLKKVNLRIVSIPFESQARRGQEDLSLREFAEIISTLPAYRNTAWIAVNGGFSSYAPSVPAGLLVSRDKVYSRTAAELTGVLCQLASNASWKIMRSADYRAGQCREALQAGPLVVEPGGRAGIGPKEATTRLANLRTVVCLTPDARMKIILTQQPTHLYPLAQWLARSERQGGAGCDAALNLSGDTSSGIAIKGTPREGLSFRGPGSYPLPSALIFEPQDTPAARALRRR